MDKSPDTRPCLFCLKVVDIAEANSRNIAGKLPKSADIQSSTWSFSLLGFNVLVQGIGAIRQRIDLAIRTSKGTDPLRMEFGSDVYKYVDMPVNIAVPNIKKCILDALEVWVPEITVVSINHYFETISNPVFEITYRVPDEDLIDTLLFDVANGQIVADSFSEFILQAFIPPNPNEYQYQVKLLKNTKPVAPAPYKWGFESMEILFAWVKENYSFAGRWYLLIDRLVCYMSAKGVTSASLTLSLLPTTRFWADIPAIIPGSYTTIYFDAGGKSLTSDRFKKISTLLAYAQDNWSNYGDWFIEYRVNDNVVFSDEFSDEMDSPSSGYRLVCVTGIAGFVGVLTIKNSISG